MRTCMNDNWEFCELCVDSTLQDAQNALDEGQGQQVTLPHDWMISNCGDLYRNGRGWYRKVIDWNGEAPRASVLFDGVYQDSVYYLNGEQIGEWRYGYTRHEIDLTGHLVPGRNTLVVSVTFEAPNSRWYSGAGINRNVWLVTNEETRIEDGGIYLAARQQADGHWLLRVETEITGPDAESAAVQIALRYKGAIVTPVSVAETEPLLAAEREQQVIRAQILELDQVTAWDIEDPALYDVTSELIVHGDVLQTEALRYGFRTIQLDPNEGCLVNGRHIKIHGVCLHSDAGALGNTFHKEAVIRQFTIMKELGANALRLAHNPYAAEVLDIADEMGFLVIDEALDMWERSKNPYDYARFFTEWQERDMRSYVRRDRNHPCVFLWSIGNEIYDQHVSGERGVELSRMLMEEVRALDPCGHAAVTTGSNYMPWENAQRCADVYGVAGYNYGEQYYEQHHKDHPDWVIYGSETSSICQSRGIYHFPLSAGILSEEDLQCSALGNAVTSWGTKRLEDVITYDRDLPYSLGQFVWAGLDYLGEPTPYKTKNSYLGMADTAGFPKDDYYVFQAAWTDAQTNPMIHVFPYWDYNEGQLIDVRVCSNLPVVRLYVNGRSLGQQHLAHDAGSGTHVIADWQVPYETGEITAVGYREEIPADGGEPVLTEVCRETRHSFGNTASFEVTEDHRTTLDGESSADGLHYYAIRAIDKDGYPVENASDYVQVTVTGGRLVGLDNGDSTDTTNYDSPCRHLFSGMLLAIAEGPADMEIAVTPIAPVAVRKVTLVPEDGRLMGPDHTTVHIRAVVEPADAADQEVHFSVVDARGVEANIARIEQRGSEAVITAVGDGTFYVRCTSRSGDDHTRVISQIEYTVEGLGEAYLNPYGFISGSLYSDVQGVVGNGNEKGIATARDGETTVTWSDIDYGKAGSDEVTIAIFALTSEEYPIEIWEGRPGDPGAVLLADAVYCKPTIWNTYQPETFHLRKRLKGVTSMSIRVHQKIHIKGFSFTEQSRAWLQLTPADADEIYGDSYEVDGDGMRHIGNNVTLLYHDMDYQNTFLHGIRISGGSDLAQNTIHVRFYDGVTEHKEIVEFKTSGGRVQEFPLPAYTGKWDVSIVFLPGSDYDLDWFRFY